MRRPVTSLLVVVLVGCNGPEHFPSPPAAPSGDVAPTRLTLMVSPVELPEGGGTATLYVETSVDGHRAAPRVRVALAAEGGTLEMPELVTDGTGHGKLSWNGTAATTITAHAGDLQTSAQIRLAAPNGGRAPIPPPNPPQFPPPPPPVDPLPPTPANPTVTVRLTADPATVLIGAPVTLTAAATTNTEAGGVRSYTWDLDGDGTTDQVTTSAALTTSYPAAGSRTPRVVATSASWATATATTIVTVTAPTPPATTVTLSVTPRPVAATTPATFTATVANLAAGESVVSYEWDFDTTTTGIDQVTIVPTANHTYPAIGIKSARVRILTSNARVIESAVLQVAVN